MIKLTLTIEIVDSDRCKFHIEGHPEKDAPSPSEVMIARELGSFVQANFGEVYAAARYKETRGVVSAAETHDPIPEAQPVRAPTESANPPSGPGASEPGAEAEPSPPAEEPHAPTACAPAPAPADPAVVPPAEAPASPDGPGSAPANPAAPYPPPEIFDQPGD